jgi:hypothetical protein
MSIRVAVVPALGVASFSILLTTASLVGMRLGNTSITLVAAGFVVAAAAVCVVRPPQGFDPPRALMRELLTLLVLTCIVVFALASSWDVAYPVHARGTDWGHYLLYADEVATQRHLLIDDPFAGEPDRVFADPAATGAVYGSLRLVDGLSSWSLTAGLVVVSALAVLSVFAAAAALWGSGPGLVAAAAYAVAPIRLDLMSWYGLGTALALLFVPLVVMSVGLLFRGARGCRHVAFLALCLLGVTVSHTTTAIVVFATVLLAPIVDAARLSWAHRGQFHAVLRKWWGCGVVRPLAGALMAACVVGAGVAGHVTRQTLALGQPVSWRSLGPEWLSRAAIEHYFGGPFLIVALVAVVVVAASPRLRNDPALLAVVSLALACVLVGESWRVHVSYDYQRVVYYVGVALVLLVGAAFVSRGPPRWWRIAVVVVVLVALARSSVGLRLPERVLERVPRDPAVAGLVAFRERLDSGALPETTAIVSDGCLHFAVPYLVHRPTLPAFSERQVGFAKRMPLARRAAAILAGGSTGRDVAHRLGVGYAVADPSCIPDLASRLGGTTVLENDGVLVVRLPGLR